MISIGNGSSATECLPTMPKPSNTHKHAWTLRCTHTMHAKWFSTCRQHQRQITLSTPIELKSYWRFLGVFICICSKVIWPLLGLFLWNSYQLGMELFRYSCFWEAFKRVLCFYNISPHSWECAASPYWWRSGMRAQVTLRTKWGLVF